jgi:hypothetical protein
VVHAILASSHKISFGFVGESCNTHIKKKEFDWFMGGWCNTQNQYEKYIYRYEKKKEMNMTLGFEA